MLWFALLACKPDAPGVPALIDAGRSEHFFDAPFPDESLASDGLLAGFPVPEPPLAASIVEGWRSRVELANEGFGNNTPAYFRFADSLDLPETLPGAPTDPVLWIDVDTGELHPVDLRFVADPQGDPFYAPNTLAVVPTLGSPTRSGHRYAVVVTEAAGAAAPEGWEPSDEVLDALEAAGVSDEAATATVFTVQDATGALRRLAADVDSRIGSPALTWRRVVRLSYTQGSTPSGNAATLATVTYDDATTAVTYLGASTGAAPNTIELDDDWPLLVYEAELPVYNYQGLADRPYMSPGLSHISDTDRVTGWMTLDSLDEPEPETMRIVLGVPRTGAQGVVLHDHGTGGHAYNIVQRRSSSDDGRRIAQIYADAGWAMLGRDAPLYGTRFPLIDEGYSSFLGFYNIVNAPAWRDNHRQTGLDGHVLRRYVQDGLAADLPDGLSIDTSRVRSSGHSLGAVTTHLSLAIEPDAYESAFVSGTGGLFLHYFFDTGLIEGLDPALLQSLFPLFGATAPETFTTQSALGAVLGLPEPAWDQVDRLHPAAMLFQWQMDPSDPMSVARDEDLPIRMVIAPGDQLTPDFTAEALAQALPDASTRRCQARGSYDPHYCVWREEQGFEALAEWLAEGL